jgi:hypothetical protein
MSQEAAGRIDRFCTPAYLLIRNYRTAQDIEQRACSQPNPQWIGRSAAVGAAAGRVKIADAAAVGAQRLPPPHSPDPLPPDGAGAVESTLLALPGQTRAAIFIQVRGWLLPR